MIKGNYGNFKKNKIYKRAQDVNLIVNGEEPIDEMYYPYELDELPVIGFGFDGKSLDIDIICVNWEDRFELGWIAE